MLFAATFLLLSSAVLDWRFAACRALNFLVLTAGETTIRLMPALTITQEIADEALVLFEKALKTL